MAATQMDIPDMEQGATKVWGFVWRNEDPLQPGVPGAPVDLTGCTARMQIRKKQGEPILVEAVSDGADPEIILGGATGQITVKLSAEQTSMLTSKTSQYDMEIVMPNGDVHRAVEGTITTKPNITQLPSEPVVT